jgi:hypothetical protein
MSTDILASLTKLSAAELLAALRRLVADDRHLTADLVAHLGEVDSRRLYLQAACPSMFSYCVDILHFSEDQAFKRIRAARAARDFPAILALIATGELHLSAVALLAPHLTKDNHLELLRAARGKSKRQIEELLAARFPQPDVAPQIRRLPAPRPCAGAEGEQDQAVLLPPAALPAAATTTPPPAPPADPAAPLAAVARVSAPPTPALTPLSAQRYKLQLTVSLEVRDKLRQAQDLLRPKVPDGDLGVVFERALDVLLKELRRKQYAETASPRPPRAEGAVSEAQAGHPGLGSDRASDDESSGGSVSKKRSRYIPRHVRREVARRDGFQCTYVDPQTGRRCPQRGGLQFHHRDPFAKGGATTAANVCLACSAHNGAAAVGDYGAAHMARRIAEARRARERRRAGGGPGASANPGGEVAPPTRGTQRPRPPMPP